MTKYEITHILHTDTAEKKRVLDLIHWLSVYEPKGALRNVVNIERASYEHNGKGLVEFNIVTAHNEAGALVGYTFYYPKEKTIEIYVLPHWRRKGVGTALIQGVRHWTGISTISAYSGFGEWREFFKANYILCLCDYEGVSNADIEKYGDAVKAWRTRKANAKRQLSMAYQSSLKADSVQSIVHSFNKAFTKGKVRRLGAA